MKSKNPLVTAVIVNWNGLKDTIECLDSLRKITYSNFQIIIIDNGSKENEAEKLKKIVKSKNIANIDIIRNKKTWLLCRSQYRY